MQKLDSLQAVRAVAALLVLLFHTQTIFMLQTGITPFAGFFANGDKGVDLFFVLSGFIMVYVHYYDIGRAGRTWNYAYNRLTRIYPLVWIMCIFALLVYGIGFHHDKASKLDPLPLLQSFLLLPQNEPALVNVTWTLKYEIFFYLLFGLSILNRTLGIIVIGLWQFAILALLIANVDTSPLWAFYLRPISLEFGFGIAVALLFIAAQRRRLPSAAVGGTAFLTGFAIFAHYFVATVPVDRALSFGLASALIIAGCCFLERSGHFHPPKFAVTIGDASYAIYLIHYSVLTLIITVLAHKHLAPVTTPVVLAVAVFAFVVGMGFYYTVDRPISRVASATRRKLFGARAAAPVNAELGKTTAIP